jgi:small subunit ribosomal protein S1
MSNTNTPESQPTPENNESFADLLSQFEKGRAKSKSEGPRQVEATVISQNAESVFLDIGYKTEGILPISALLSFGRSVQPGDKLPVTIKGRNEDGYYEVSLFKERRPTDWTALESAFAEKATIGGTVTAQVKGGFSVDVGVRAFMPASRSGAREAADMAALIGQDIRCRIIKLDVADEDVVVDRRAVLEEEELASRQRRFGELKEGDVVHGTVRSLMDYGAFIDLGGVDGLLHVAEIGWTRIGKPADALNIGDEIDAKILKIDPDTKKISLSMRQLQEDPWHGSVEKYRTGDRVKGKVTRVVEFGAFVELEPGIEGLIHISEMSWSKKIKRAADIVKPGDVVDVVVLGVNPQDKRISLGLKQTLGDPWAETMNRIKVGSVVEGPITNLMKFGAFMQVAEGVEGLIHISEISAEKRLNHPQDELKLGQVVKAQVVGIDPEKRQLRLSMKQLVPTDVDEYFDEHKAGDVVTGRVRSVSGNEASVELGEGVLATCISSAGAQATETPNAGADLSSLSAMLSAKWKSGGSTSSPTANNLREGEVRSFRIKSMNKDEKKIVLELA